MNLLLKALAWWTKGNEVLDILIEILDDNDIVNDMLSQENIKSFVDQLFRAWTSDAPNYSRAAKCLKLVACICESDEGPRADRQ